VQLISAGSHDVTSHDKAWINLLAFLHSMARVKIDLYARFIRRGLFDMTDIILA
jgi:hypothetical protein